MKQGRRILVLAAIAGSAVGTALLLRFPPDQYSFYPACPVYALLHLQCPGCGSTRALASLLHGRLEEALQSNALFVLLLPAVLGYGLLCGFRAWTAKEFRWPTVPRFLLQAAMGVSVAFGIVRNLPL